MRSDGFFLLEANEVVEAVVPGGARDWVELATVEG